MNKLLLTLIGTTLLLTGCNAGSSVPSKETIPMYDVNIPTTPVESEAGPIPNPIPYLTISGTVLGLDDYHTTKIIDQWGNWTYTPYWSATTFTLRNKYLPGDFYNLHAEYRGQPDLESGGEPVYIRPCLVENESGTITANVTNVIVDCRG